MSGFKIINICIFDTLNYANYNINNGFQTQCITYTLYYNYAIYNYIFLL